MNTGDSAALRVMEVSKHYAGVKALDGVSLSVAPGEFVALLGPNGAGKSTLFQLLTGLFTADGGTVLVHELDMRTDAVQALAKLGVVFQQPTLDLDLSVRANLMFHGQLHGMGRRLRQRIDSELERLDLLDQQATPCRALSGGNRRKVELARGLLHEPAVLLMDEATVGLDPRSRASLLDYVHQLCRDRSMAVLWATHLVDEAERADRIVVLHQGHVLWDGTPVDLTRETASANLNEAFLTLTGKPKEAADLA